MKKKLSKRLQQLSQKLDYEKTYSMESGVEAVKSLASAKFDETVEVALRLGVDPRHADQMVRGAVVLPHGTGKTVRVAVFAKDIKADEARNAGADVVGDDLRFALRRRIRDGSRKGGGSESGRGQKSENRCFHRYLDWFRINICSESTGTSRAASVSCRT